MEQQTRTVPIEDKSIKVVDNLKDFCEESFGDEASVILLRRKLAMDFNAAASDLRKIFKNLPDAFEIPGLKRLDPEMIERALPKVSNKTKKALNVILDDMRFLEEKWDNVQLRLIPPGDGDGQGYHVDDITDDALGRVLCCYNTPTTEGLLPEEVRKTGRDSYNAENDAEPFSFQIGDIFRGVCNTYSGKRSNDAPPFVHRAPRSNTTRLLLVADPG